MYKLDQRTGEDWKPHSYAPQFATDRTSSDTLRLVAGVPGGDSSVLLKLIECLEAPFFALYVLHSPRGEGDPGRYQSPELEPGELRAFVSRFSKFFAGDARFDFWVHSPVTGGTLVWDRHNLIFGYGPIDCFGRALGSLGFSSGAPVVPDPHRHHYREEFDEEARALLSEYSWHYSPLRPEDDQ